VAQVHRGSKTDTRRSHRFGLKKKKKRKRFLCSGVSLGREKGVRTKGTCKGRKASKRSRPGYETSKGLKMRCQGGKRRRRVRPLGAKGKSVGGNGTWGGHALKASEPELLCPFPAQKRESRVASQESVKKNRTVRKQVVAKKVSSTRSKSCECGAGSKKAARKRAGHRGMGEFWGKDKRKGECSSSKGKGGVRTVRSDQ